MIEIVAPKYSNEVDVPSVFLAGGITGCPDWQKIVVDALKYRKGTIFNPRRPKFNSSAAEARRQIYWEFHNMDFSDIISFWFSSGGYNMITLYELGRYIDSDKKIVVGVDPDYIRKLDVIEQVKLARYDIQINHSLRTHIHAIQRTVDGFKI